MGFRNYYSCLNILNNYLLILIKRQNVFLPPDANADTQAAYSNQDTDDQGGTNDQEQAWNNFATWKIIYEWNLKWG